MTPKHILTLIVEKAKSLEAPWMAPVTDRLRLVPRRLAVLGMVVLAAVVAGAFAFGDQGSSSPRYRTAKIQRGPLVSTVSTSGTLQALVTVLVGSQLSGQIKELLADYNTKVKKGQVIARLDTDLLVARLRQAEADLRSAEAGLAMQRAQAERAKFDIDKAKAERTKAEAALADARRDYIRKAKLAKRGVGTRVDASKAKNAVAQAKAGLGAAQAALAATTAAHRVATAQVASAEATVAQRTAAVEIVQVDLNRSVIRSPIDGVVVARSVDLGQTVAASLQAPTLFTIAQDLRKLEVHARVDEADVGRLAVGQQATFTVAAFPGRTFRSTVKQIRLAPQEEQSVVTYTVVISAINTDLTLLPGMTADVKIVTARREKTLKVPNAALRYRPPGAAANVGAGGFRMRRGISAQTIAARIAKALDLSDEQRLQVVAIFTETRAEMEKMRNQRMRRDQRSQRMSAIRRAASQKMTAIFTDRQRAKYAALRKQRANRARGRIYLLGSGGKPKAVMVRIGITDGSFSEVRGRGLAPGLVTIVGQARAGRKGGGSGRRPRLGF